VRAWSVRGTDGGKTGTTDEYAKELVRRLLRRSVVPAVWVGFDQPLQFGEERLTARGWRCRLGGFTAGREHESPGRRFREDGGFSRRFERCRVSYSRPSSSGHVFTETASQGDVGLTILSDSTRNDWAAGVATRGRFFGSHGELFEEIGETRCG